MRLDTGFATFALACLISQAMPVQADWSYSDTPSPNAFIQTDKATVALQCDRIRFAPASFDDSQDIVSKQGLSIRFMKNGATEAGAFQAGPANSTIRIVDNYPVEVVLSDRGDYDFVLDQLSRNAVLNLSMVDQDITYGIFGLEGSGTAIESLRAACASQTASRPQTSSAPDAASSPGVIELPDSAAYCGGGQIKRRIEYVLIRDAKDQWDVRVSVNGAESRAMTAYSFYGKAQPPKGFVAALLGEDRAEYLVFRDGGKDWLELGDYAYWKCD